MLLDPRLEELSIIAREKNDFQNLDVNVDKQFRYFRPVTSRKKRKNIRTKN